MAGPQDTVTVVLDRRTAENHYYALALALGAAGPLGGVMNMKKNGRGKSKPPGKTSPKEKVPKRVTR